MNNSRFSGNCLPAEWKLKTIDDLSIRVGSGITPTGGSEVYKPDGVIFIRSQNVTNKELNLSDVVYIDNKTHQSMARSEVLPFDVLLNITGASIGRCCFMPEGLGPANQNQHVCTIRLTNSNLPDANFLTAILISHIGQQQILRLNAGGNREGLNYQQIKTFQVPWPSSMERSKISQILTTIDRVIIKTEALIDKLRQVKAGMLHDLLTRGLDENGELRDPIRHPEQFKDSPLGRIPKVWNIFPLSAITQKIADRDHTTPHYVSNGVRMVSPTHFYGEDHIDFENCPHISRNAHAVNRKKTDIESGDIILHRIGAGLGRVRLVKNWMPDFSILHSLAQIRVAKEIVNERFIFWAFQLDLVQDQLGIGTQSIGVPDLGLDKIGKSLFPIPQNIEEQILISDSLDAWKDTIIIEEIFKNKYLLIKQGLMQDLLTGRVRVPEAMLQKYQTEVAAE
jgi:type I restriction enzyme, S subunit